VRQGRLRHLAAPVLTLGEIAVLHVFKSDTMPHNPERLSNATAQLNERADEYLSDKPGLLVAGVGQLYFHMARFLHGGECFTMFLPVMFAQAAGEDDE
jgi:hypothetical protein